MALLLLALTAVAAVAFSPQPGPLGAAVTEGESDVSLHSAVVGRLERGESYYDVTGDELRRRGYPSRSVFNWRSPLLFSAVALAPRVARVVLIALGVVLLVLTVKQLAPEPSIVVLGGAIAQAGALPITLVPGAVLLHEVWTGVFIALSVCLYLRQRPAAGAAVGALALFVRELAAPYCVVAAVLAFRARRWREVVVWAAALVGYVVYFATHVQQVLAHRRPDDISHLDSWVQWGGLPFILSTLRWNGWLAVLPLWVAAIVFVVLVAGIFENGRSEHLRLCVGVYLLLFAAAGHTFNNYWGVIPLFTYPLLFGYALRHVSSLFRDAVAGH